MAYTVLTHAVLSSIRRTYWMISFLFPANYIKPLFSLYCDGWQGGEFRDRRDFWILCSVWIR